MKQENLIKAAKKEIEAKGWKIKEHHYNGESHLEFTRGHERKGWGMFETLYCWTEAYQSITGKHWMTLLKKA